MRKSQKRNRSNLFLWLIRLFSFSLPFLFKKEKEREKETGIKKMCKKIKRNSSFFFLFLSTPNFLFYLKYARNFVLLIFEKEGKKKRKAGRCRTTRSSQNKKRRIECINSAVNLEVLRKLMRYTKRKIEENQRKSYIHFSSFSPNFLFIISMKENWRS